MPIEVSDADAEALGVADKGALAQYLEKFETDRTKARQAVIEQKDTQLRAFTELGLTPDEIKSLQEATKSARTDQDVEKLIQKAVEESNATAAEKVNARSRAAEVRAQAAELGFIKPAQALALLDQKKLAAVAVDDDGEADAAEVKKLLEDLAKDSPHLLKPTDTTADHRTAGIGSTGSGTKPEVRPGIDRVRNAYANTTNK